LSNCESIYEKEWNKVKIEEVWRNELSISSHSRKQFNGTGFNQSFMLNRILFEWSFIWINENKIKN
jgi:hypothetical protein